MFVLDAYGELEQFYEDDITRKRYNNYTGAPDEPTNLSASIDWKELRDQRKIKLKTVEQILDMDTKKRVREVDQQR